MPSIDASTAGDNGLVSMDPGDSANLSILVTNNGNVDDTILLSVDQGPGLAAFWSNWSSGGHQTTPMATIVETIQRQFNGGNSTGGLPEEIQLEEIQLEETAQEELNWWNSRIVPGKLWKLNWRRFLEIRTFFLGG